ncbi:MAG TPA: glycerophosphodiester phosphodiesterase, partial [Candidatus Limnocylindrales bacterium]
DEAIDLVVGAGLGLCVEIKGETADAAATAVQVARHLEARGLVERVFVSSFDHAALAAARTAVPNLILAPERLPEAGPSDPLRAADQARALGAAALQHRWEDLAPEVVEAVHAAGSAVWAWPIDTLESIQASVAVGVDAIIGDDVRLLLEGLAGDAT